MRSPDILIDTTDLLTLSEVYDALPPRQVADQLVSVYFSTRYVHLRKYSCYCSNILERSC